jgi:cell division protein FtsX
MTVAFDTLKLARRLEAAGFPTKQAQDTAEVLGDALTANVATQTDIQALRAELREVELRLRADLHAEIAALRVEMIKWVVGVGVGVAGVLAIGGMLLALMRMLPHP